MLTRRLRRRPNIKTTLGQRLVFAGEFLVDTDQMSHLCIMSAMEMQWCIVN